MKHLLIAWLCFFATLSTWATPVSMVYDISANRIVSQQGDNTQRPIASLTKLMTAMVVLDSKVPLGELVTINRLKGTILPQKDYSRLELLYAMLVKSDNSAAETLAENHPGGRSRFMATMNQRAREMGLTNTQFADPSGLSIFNISTLIEVGVMLQTANDYELIRNISTQREVRLVTNKKRSVNLLNTNHSILTQFKDIVVSKTGFTNPAGFCIGMVLNRQGHEFIVVVLGEKNKHQRTATVNRIMKELS